MAKLHAPKTGVGYSAGQNPRKVSTETGPKAKASHGQNTGTKRSGDASTSHVSKAGDVAAMRKPGYR